jgi:hypothetical protein
LCLQLIATRPDLEGFHSVLMAMVKPVGEKGMIAIPKSDGSSEFFVHVRSFQMDNFDWEKLDDQAYRADVFDGPTGQPSPQARRIHAANERLADDFLAVGAKVYPPLSVRLSELQLRHQWGDAGVDERKRLKQRYDPSGILGQQLVAPTTTDDQG